MRSFVSASLRAFCACFPSDRAYAEHITAIDVHMKRAFALGRIERFRRSMLAFADVWESILCTIKWHAEKVGEALVALREVC